MELQWNCNGNEDTEHGAPMIRHILVVTKKKTLLIRKLYLCDLDQRFLVIVVRWPGSTQYI